MTPADCRTKDDVRRQIDRIDRALVDLLAERFGYIQRMAEMKKDPDEARIDTRVNDVLAKVAALAGERGLDPGLLGDLWRRLMDWNIEWERRAIAARTRSGESEKDRDRQ